jgi:V8-like Glu-specific endopeptidase
LVHGNRPDNEAPGDPVAPKENREGFGFWSLYVLQFREVSADERRPRGAHRGQAFDHGTIWRQAMENARIRVLGLTLLVSVSALVSACASESTAPESTSATEQRIIYGSDDRKEIGQLTNPRQIAWAKATGSFFDDTDVSCSGGNCVLTTKTYGDTQGGVYLPLCSGERFAGQPQGAHCTGFLIAPDLVATAGHCFVSKYYCDHTALVFGFSVTASGQARTTVPEKDVYRCSAIVAQANEQASADGLGDEDFAVLRLDRPVTDRTPFSLRQTGMVPNNAAIATIGDPLGLPLKYTGGGSVRNNLGSARFETSLDASAGYSGAPVFNASTGLVEGVLASGPGVEFATEPLPDGGVCERTTHCSEVTGCQNQAAWVRATRIQSVVAVLEGRSCHDKVRNGQETDVDCGGPDCDPCLMGNTCQQDSDCYQFPYDCRQEVCNQNHQCALDYSTCGCVVDADCDDGIACTNTYCNQGSFSCEEASNSCECTHDTDCDDGQDCTRDSCSTTTRTCVHDASACQAQCTEAKAIDMGTTANVITVPNNACLRVRDQYPAWWGQRTMQLASWDQGTYPVPFTWANTCAASAGSGTFTANWQSQYLSQTNAACATLISLNGTGSGNISLVYY